MRRRRARGGHQTTVLLKETRDAFDTAELRPATNDLEIVDQLESDSRCLEALCVVRKRNQTSGWEEIETADFVYQRFARVTLDFLPGLVGAFCELDVVRPMVRIANDPSVIVRATTLVPELELLDAEDVLAELAREPVERTAADASHPEHDRFVLGSWALELWPLERWTGAGHERSSWYSTADMALPRVDRHSRFDPTGLPSASPIALTWQATEPQQLPM